MATVTKFQDYVEQLNLAIHNWGSHTFKAALSNTAPNAGDDEFADITEIAAGNGYSAGGMTLDSVTLTETGGTAKVTIADEVLTASGGSIGPFRYIAVYNDTSTGDKLVYFYDYGSSITLLDGETLTLDFDPTAGAWTLA